MKGTCKLWPHGHRDKGPLQLIIGSRSQPSVVQQWGSGQVRAVIQQPHKETNLTMIGLLFVAPWNPYPFPAKGLKYYNVKHYWRQGGTLDVRIKNRVWASCSMVPFGQYKGSILYEEGLWAVMTFQAGGGARPSVPVEKTIITPGDKEYGRTLADAEKALGLQS